MFIFENLGVNDLGNLTICGADVVDLARKYGTPLYVLDENLIIKNCKRFNDAINKYYNGHGLVCYASKAFSCREIYRLINALDMGVDAVSLGEMYTALSVDFPAKKMHLHGNNKTVEELKFALENNIGRIIVDNFCELRDLNRIAKELNLCAKIILRVKPGIDAHTHEFIKTGQIDSKFGFAIETGEALEAAKLAFKLENVWLKGAHCHIGSQIFDEKPFALAAQFMAKYSKDVKEEIGIEFSELNLGGGFGVKYTQKDNPLEYEEYVKAICSSLAQKCREYGLKQPYLIIEPGRALIAAAGITLYTVGNIKTIPNVRKYVAVDGGMTDNPRYALYKAEHEAIIANKADKPKNEIVTIAGKCCESGDLIGEDIAIQAAQPGDILAVCATGAYNYSMASNYNRNLKPAVVMIKDAKSRVIVRRETLEDLIRNDL